MRPIQTLSIVIVLLHLLITVPHGLAHGNLQIEMNTWQNVYILTVINILPLVAAILIWRRKRLGFTLLMISMAGSFLFGVFYHFIAAGPDNVAAVPDHPWTHTFQLTALLLAMSEAAGVLAGFVGLSRSS